MSLSLSIYAIARARGWVNTNYREYRHFQNLLKRQKEAGIKNVYFSRSDFARYRKAQRLSDYLEGASGVIRVVGYWFAHGNEAEGVAERIAQLARPPRKLDVELALIDPTGPCIPQLATYLGIPEDELVMRIRSSLSNLHRAQQALPEEDRERFRLKVYQTIPLASVIMLDPGTPSGRTQVELKPYRTPREYSFSFELCGAGNQLYDLCTDAWSNLLADAQPFDPTVHLQSPRDK